MKKEYGAEQAEIILGICANIISGQVSGDSAKKFAETFGKIMQDRQSLSINSSDTSISKSSQMDYAIPASKIATFSSGEFGGIMADSPNEKIKLKMFHGEIQNDHEAIAKEEKLYKPIPVVKMVSAEEIRTNYQSIKAQVADLLKAELVDSEAKQNKKTSGTTKKEVLKAKKSARKGKPKKEERTGNTVSF